MVKIKHKTSRKRGLSTEKFANPCSDVTKQNLYHPVFEKSDKLLTAMHRFLLPSLISSCLFSDVIIGLIAVLVICKGE